jgi:leucyl/phenylalanyl-tRNA--protein transferase
VLTPEAMLSGYAQGIFPMAGGRDEAELHWVDPRQRGVFPLQGFHISRSLAREIRRGNYTIRTNTTWINAPLAALYDRLHAMGHAHSLEVWQEEALAGGVFGVTLGAAFFGESMFSTRANGSKIALAYLVDRLRQAGFTLFDTQFLTPHLASLGAVEVPRAAYLEMLAAALAGRAEFTAPAVPDPHSLSQRMTQTS